MGTAMPVRAVALSSWPALSEGWLFSVFDASAVHGALFRFNVALTTPEADVN